MAEICNGYKIVDDGHFSDCTPLTILDSNGNAICAVPAQGAEWVPSDETNAETWELARRICAGLPSGRVT